MAYIDSSKKGELDVIGTIADVMYFIFDIIPSSIWIFGSVALTIMFWNAGEKPFLWVSMLVSGIALYIVLEFCAWIMPDWLETIVVLVVILIAFSTWRRR